MTGKHITTRKSQRNGDRESASEAVISLERGVRRASRRPNVEADPADARPRAKKDKLRR